MENTNENMVIPERYQQLCKDIARVLREFELDNNTVDKYDGVYSFTGKFQPRGMGPDWGEIQFMWESGRHFDGVGQITITSHIKVQTKIGEKPSDS